MKHLGILAHSTEGAALCLRAFCQEGFGELGPHEHPDVQGRSWPFRACTSLRWSPTAPLAMAAPASACLAPGT